MTKITTGINTAVELLKAGEVVALPTETVYGLAGNALDPAAIAKIFAAKNRPRDNPLIVHVSGLEMARELGLEIPDLAEKLAEKFWGGPLTMILRRTSAGGLIPPEVSCGMDSVAARVPNSPIMLEIIEKCGFPLAAPSANLSGSPSPTAAKHVYDDLQGRIPLIIDGGNCQIGIESTVIAFENVVKGSVRTITRIRILRPGAVTPKMLSEFSEIAIDGVVYDRKVTGDIPSPGTKHKHYAPKAKVIAFEGNVPAEKFVIDSPNTRTLFAKFREFDEQGADKIFVRLPEPVGIGLALYNRIIRAAEFNVIRT